MDRAQIETAFAETFDQGLLFHSFTKTMRDYQAIIEIGAAPSTGIATRFDRYLFKACVELNVETTVAPGTWRNSASDDRLLDATLANRLNLEGYVWGVEFQDAYPGFTLLPRSSRTDQWQTAIGIPFHEATFEGNAHRFSLVFSDLEVTQVKPGWAPFSVGTTWSG